MMLITAAAAKLAAATGLSPIIAGNIKLKN
jgi:hypothetical protein